MAIRFRKSFKVAPGMRVNVSSRGVGASVGGKGLRYSVNSRGQRRTTMSIPGTGLSSTSYNSSRSYKSAAQQNKQALARQQKEIAKQEELERARYEVQVFENKIDLIHSIHKECDDHFDWFEISRSKHPHHTKEIGLHEMEAQEKLNSFKPTLMQKMLKTVEKEELKLRNEVVLAREQDSEEFKELIRTTRLANRILQQDTDAYLQVIEELSPLDDLLEFGSGFEFIIEDPKTLEVEFNVHSKDIVPSEQKSLTKTGKLSVKEMPKSRYYDITQDYVCSCSIRIARDMFAILPFDTVIIHAMDDILDTSTGRNETLPILSVRFDKATLNNLNFEAIDCSDSMVNFQHNMKFKKTQGFSPIEKVQVSH
ncbi:DUF4236 domain-containing protein [Planococcus faecalis]|uniref:DUF4236 domain-containing protein n=1 Tax=Planococcus faecalis TaxID=1598147 RepID=A0ABN4XF27_9BACL|nr:DUF4236 domain-containing protein [Planococcus faecalis]AQU78417.1 hypothetical protein AJGP001_03490 [Planococcus faecalis]OHX52387.1 hypothetical protein BB777_12125 [Planococcus faecalis]